MISPEISCIRRTRSDILTPSSHVNQTVTPTIQKWTMSVRRGALTGMLGPRAKNLPYIHKGRGKAAQQTSSTPLQSSRIKRSEPNSVDSGVLLLKTMHQSVLEMWQYRYILMLLPSCPLGMLQFTTSTHCYGRRTIENE